MTNTTKINLIIADDHPIFRKGLQNILKGTTCISEIFTAQDGSQVIEYLELKHHDVVLMDIRMKPLDGMKATQIISQKFPNTKVIALTINDDEESVISMMKCGAYGYLLKSSDKEEIVSAIKYVSEGKIYFSNEISYVLTKKIIDSPLKQKENLELECDRIRDILYLMYQELSNNEIAELLCLSHRTIEYYRKRITLLTYSRNSIGAIKYALKKGILTDISLSKKWEKILKNRFKVN